MAGEEERGYEDVCHQGQQRDEGAQIKDEKNFIPDVDHDVPDFSVDACMNRAEVVEEPEVKPETEALPVCTEG